MSTILGKVVSNGAVQASSILSANTGRNDILDPDDLDDSHIEIKGTTYDLDYSNTKRLATFGVEGETVTREEFALHLQKLADRMQSQLIVILSNGQKINVDPVMAPDQEAARMHKNMQSYHKNFLKLVSSLTRAPLKDVPARLDAHLTPNYTYYDNTEYLHPEKFWLFGEGDCNDYAIFSYFILSKTGYKPRYFTLYIAEETKPGELPSTHSICVYTDPRTGRLNYFDQNCLVQAEASTLEEVFMRAKPTWYKVQEINLTINKDWTISMHVAKGPEFTYRNIPAK